MIIVCVVSCDGIRVVGRRSVIGDWISNHMILVIHGEENIFVYKRLGFGKKMILVYKIEEVETLQHLREYSGEKLISGWTFEIGECFWKLFG